MEKMKVDEEMANLKMSSEDEDLEKAARIRVQGNEFYKAGNLVKAIEAYNEAAAAAPSDHLPLSNLSAAYFESGQYRLCVKACEQAIDRAGDHKTSVINKVFPRMVKSLMNLFEWQSATKFWLESKQYLEPAVSSAFDEKVLGQAEKSWKLLHDERAVKKKVLSTLPRYRQPIYDGRIEYYHYGHDNAEPLFDRELAGSQEPSTNLFFGGIGDGRNLFATLISIASHERAITKNFEYHITLNDINPHSIARLLIFFHIFTEMAEAKERGTLAQEEAMSLTTLYYLFASVAMPPCVFDRVHRIICKTIDLLEKGETAIGIDIESTRTSVIRALKSWRDNAPTYVPVSLLLEKHVKSQDNVEERGAEKAEAEHALFLTTGAILAPHLLRHEEKAMCNPLKNLGRSPTRANITAMKSYLGQKWKPNVTILDLDWLKGDISLLNLAYNPFGLAVAFYEEICQNQDSVIIETPKESTHLYEYIAPFFRTAFESWMQLRGKVKIEAVVGDAIDLFEGFQHDIFDGRPDNYPRHFDRIHMTNISDYVGGPLSIFLYAIKVIRPGTGRFVTGECLYNFSAFTSMAQYYNEYMVINDDKSLRKLMKVQLTKTSKPMPPLFPVAEYKRWQQTSSEALPFSALYSRPNLAKWLYALFFRLSVPVDQTNARYGASIFQTPNLSIYFRVLSHLHQIGYPGHWLSEILTNLLCNNVVTSARPPRTSPLEVDESRKNMPVKKLNTAPYILEMRSLSTLFQRFLPFPMSSLLPNPETIYRYAIRIPLRQPIPANVSIQQNTLVFHRESLMDKVHHMARFGGMEPLDHILRKPFDTIPGNPATLKDYQKLYDEGLIVISTFEYDMSSNVASFWVSSEDAINVFGDHDGEGKSTDWKASLWGFMYWERYTPLVTVNGNLKKKEAWLS